MKRLFAAAAVAPLCFAATQTLAQTTISTSTTTPVATSTTGDLTIGETGSIILNNAAAVAVTVDSNNTVKNDGAVIVRETPVATAILVNVPAAGRTGDLTINGVLGADDTTAIVDTDGDGDLDGPFAAAGTERYGLRVSGPGVFTGDILFGANSETGVKGVNGSASVLIDSAMVGDVTLGGRQFTAGDDGYGLHITGPVTGDVTVSGSLAARGARAVSMAIDQNVSGRVKIDGSVQATGYRTVDRSNNQTVLDKLDADDLLQGGSAVRIRGSLGKGFLLYAPAANVDAADLDEDDDGIEDSKQTAIGAIVQYGSAPALMIGGPGAITLGSVGTGIYNDFGLVVRGNVTANGVYNGFSATGVQLGGQGGAVNVANGINLRGSVFATAYYADATGIRLGAGANVPLLQIGGSLFASNITKADAAGNVYALDIEAGANLPALVNAAELGAGVTGPVGVATVVRDSSGTLSSVTNTGKLGVTVQSDFGVSTVGRGIALDLRANTTGVTITQKNPLNGSTPAITGDVMLGTGAGSDVVDLQSGSMIGNLSFGGGADSLTLSNGSIYRGEITKGAGNLALDVASGSLSLANRGTLNATSLNVGSNSTLLFSADPQNSDASLRNGQINLSGAATLQEGSRISLTFRSKIEAPQAFTVIRAANLVNNGASLLAGTPFVYSATLSTTATEATVNVRPRTIDELGLTGGRASAFEAFYSVFDSQLAISDAVFAKTDQASFSQIYDQFLPDYSGGVFQSMALSSRAVMQAQAEEVEEMPAGEPRSWLQEISAGVSQKSTTDIGYHANGFGLAGGYEFPFGVNGATAGVSAALLSSEIRNQNRATGSALSVNTAMVGGYWRNRLGGVLLDANLNAGYLWVDSERTILDQSPGAYTVISTPATANWSGAMAAARFGASYLYKFGAFYMRPEAVLDYIYVTESGYTETGAGSAVNLQVDRRSSSEASAEAGVTFGAKFGRTFRWGPELRIAYRARLAGSMGDTTARFVSNTALPFALPALASDDGRLVVRAALRGGGAYANMALEASGEYGDLYDAYMARFVVRFLF